MKAKKFIKPVNTNQSILRTKTVRFIIVALKEALDLFMTTIFGGDRCRLTCTLGSSIGLYITGGSLCFSICPAAGAAIATLGLYGIVTTLGITGRTPPVLSAKTIAWIAGGGVLSTLLSTQLPHELDSRIRLLSILTIGPASALAVLKTMPSTAYRNILLNQETH